MQGHSGPRASWHKTEEDLEYLTEECSRFAGLKCWRDSIRFAV